MRRPRWLTPPVVALGALLVICSWLAYNQHKLREDLKQLQWESAIRDHDRDLNTITLEVGVIQFLKDGFSITLDTLESTPTGVTLVGKFGNPKALTISSLTLEIDVEHPMWQYRAAYERNPFEFIFSDTLTVGKAEAMVGDVPAGGSAEFRMVIPNVKGDLKSYGASVTLSGERYQYLR